MVSQAEPPLKVCGNDERWLAYLLNRAGQPVATFESAVAPNDPRLTAQIEKLIGERQRSHDSKLQIQGSTFGEPKALNAFQMF